MFGKLRDLAVISVLATIALVVTLLGVENVAVRTAASLPLVLILPGYALTAALFPKNRLGLAEQVLFAVGLSVAIAVISALILNWTVWGLQAGSWAGILAGATYSASIIALIRRRGGFEVTGEPVPLSINMRQGLLLIPAALIFGTALGIAQSPAPVGDLQGYTLLWMVPAANEPQDSVRLGVSSMELETASYDLRLQARGQTIREWTALEVKPGEKWESVATLPANSLQTNDVEAVLYRTNDPGTVYRRVVLKHGNNK